jgi:plastocyanin
MTCTASGVAVRGPYANLGYVAAIAPVGPPLYDADHSNYNGVVPGIDLEMHTNGQDADAAPGPFIAAGATVTWTYALTNTGEVTLTAVTVIDDLLGEVCAFDELAAGAAETCTQTGVAVEGQYASAATAVGHWPDSNQPGLQGTVSDSDASHYLGYGTAPGIEVIKFTAGERAAGAPGVLLQPGSTVTWTYQVTNIGNTDLLSITVVDDREGTVACATALPPQGWASCTLTGTVGVGQYANVVTATAASYPEGLPVTSTARSHYYGYAPGLVLEKRTLGYDADTPPGPAIAPGNAVTWTYEVSNTGNVTLEDVTVTDDRVAAQEIDCGDGNNVIASLGAGSATTCTATGVAASGSYANVGTAVVAYGGVTYEVSDPSHYSGTFYVFLPVVLRMSP